MISNMRHLSFNSIIVWLVALLGITPFVLMTYFAQPSADDWYMAADTLEIGYLQANIGFYKTVTGRFFSSAMLFAHPMLLSFGAFKCYSFALVVGMACNLVSQAPRFKRARSTSIALCIRDSSGECAAPASLPLHIRPPNTEQHPRASVAAAAAAARRAKQVE